MMWKYKCIYMYVRREVEVIDLTQSQSSDESVSDFMFDDEHYGGCDDTIHGFDERYARAILFVLYI